MGNLFTLGKENIKPILQSEQFKKKMKEIENGVCYDIFKDFKLGDDAYDQGLLGVFVENLQKEIDINKQNAGGFPKGDINFGNRKISVDVIFEEFPWLKTAYEDALDPKNNDQEKKDKFKSANIKLIYTILSLLTFRKTGTIKIKKLIVDGQEIEKPRIKISRENLVSRDNVAKQLANLRNGKIFPDGIIELKPGKTVNIGTMKIFNQFKDEYEKVESNEEKERLDTQFAEQIILNSKFYIQIDNDFIGSDDVNFKDEGTLVDDMNLCRDSLNSLDSIGYKTESLIIEDENGETYYIVRKKRLKPIPESPDGEPGGDKPGGDKPGEDKPGEDKPGEDKPGEDKPGEDKPGEDKPGEDKPDEGKPDDKPKHKKKYVSPMIDISTKFEENVVISDVSESYEDMISREVENELNEEWHNTSWFNLFKKGGLWLLRGRRRKEKIEEKKKHYERTPFTSNGVFNSEMSKQATRHDLEEILGKNGVKRDAFGKIDRKTMITEDEVSGNELKETERGKEFKQMCQDYVAGTISRLEFQNRFNNFVKVKLGLPKENQFVASNVLEKLDAIKNDNLLLGLVTKELTQYLSDHNNSHFNTIRTQIDADFKKYRRDPRFRKEILDIIGNTAGLTKEQLDEKINRFIRHQRALAKASANNLQIKLDLLTNGKGAYQTNNKDREGWLFRLGNKLDKMPRWGQALTIAGISVASMGIAGGAAALGVGTLSLPRLGTVSGAGFIGTATMSALVGAKNFIKKWTHHTKEQNTYEKNLVRDYEHEIAQMREWERIRTEKDSEGKYTHGRFKRYKAKRQLELYGKTTQESLQNENEGNTKMISDSIYAGLQNYDTLSQGDKNMLHCMLLDAKARLEVYWEKGHNFLKSRDKNQIERDFYELENALNLSASRILGPGATLKEISQIRALDASGNEVNYTDLLNLYKKDYNSASKKFRGERAWLATKWGVGTAGFTFLTSVGFQKLLGTGMYAKEAVQGTDPTSDVHEKFGVSGKDYYELGKYETSNSDIFKTAQDHISGLRTENGVSYSVKVHLSSGTDGTHLTPGSSLLDPRTYQTELQETIDAVKGSNIANKLDIIRHLEDGLPTSGFTNHTLYSMRDLNAIEQIATGSGNFNGTMEFVHDVASGVDGHIAHDATSRFTQAAIEITKTVAGQAGTEPVEAGKQWLVVGLPWFSNTFKRKNDGNVGERPVDQPIGGGNDGGNDGGDNGGNEGGDNGGNEGGDNGGDNGGNEGGDNGGDEGGNDNSPEDDKPTGVGPKPVDPKKNPDDVHKDDEPKPEDVGKKVGEVTGIVTRGHFIKLEKEEKNKNGEVEIVTVFADDSDLGVEYPGEGKMLNPMQAAENLIKCHWEDRQHKLSPKELDESREHKFSSEDIKALSSIPDRNEQINYLAKKIKEDRAKVEKSEEQREFDRMLKEIENKLPKHLEDIFGKDYEYLNKPMSKDRIHLVDDRDFLAVDCNSKDGVLGVFRSKDGDIYVSRSMLKGKMDNVLYSEPVPNSIIGETNQYTEGLFLILQTTIHEMLHSMSVINYYDTKKKGNKSDYFPRRTGLKRIKIGKDGKVSAVDGVGFNEAATESLTWEILTRWHKPYKDPGLRTYMCYKDYISIIEQMEKNDGVEKKDFWKAMLIRKRKKESNHLEKNTPRFDLVGKINGRNNENGKEKRPKYYDIIMKSMDAGVDTNKIIEFIKTKNIQHIKDGLPFDKYLNDPKFASLKIKREDVLKIVFGFDNTLLNSHSYTDFKQEILDAYKGS